MYPCTQSVRKRNGKWLDSEVRKHLRRARNELQVRGTSVPIPKFARFVGTLSCELRNQRDTIKYIILVRFFGFEVPRKAAD
jgi:hypothetical protein